MLSVYAGTGRNTIERVLRSVAEEFRRMKQEPVAEDELRRAKDHLKGSLLLSLESSGARMSNLARQEMYFGRFFTVKELQASVEAVTREDVQQIAREFFQPRKDCRNRAGSAQRFPPDSRPAGLLIPRDPGLRTLLGQPFSVT